MALPCGVLLSSIEGLAHHGRIDERCKSGIQTRRHAVVGRLSLRCGKKTAELPAAIVAAGKAARTRAGEAAADLAGMIAKREADAHVACGRAGELGVESLAE